MKPSISIFALADEAIHEERTKKNSLIGIFRFFHSSKLPAKLSKFVVFTRLIDIKDAKTIKIEIVDKNGEEISVEEYKDLNLTENKLNLSTYFFDVEFPSYGSYQINVYVNDVRLEPSPEQYIEIKESNKS